MTEHKTEHKYTLVNQEINIHKSIKELKTSKLSKKLLFIPVAKKIRRM